MTMFTEIEIAVLAREDGTALTDCMAKVAGEKKRKASDVFDIAAGCGMYCEWIGEYCENAGIKMYHGTRTLKMEDECACDGRCEAATRG